MQENETLKAKATIEKVLGNRFVGVEMEFSNNDFISATGVKKTEIARASFPYTTGNEEMRKVVTVWANEHRQEPAEFMCLVEWYRIVPPSNTALKHQVVHLVRTAGEVHRLGTAGELEEKLNKLL